jgi:hypothetical protein
MYLRHCQLDFPCNEDGTTYVWLSKCIRKYDVCDEVMAAIASPYVCHPMAPFNIPLSLVGLYLLFRLNDTDDYNAKITYIKSLQLDPLTAIFLAIRQSTLVARYHGIDVINQGRYVSMDVNQWELRKELEFCFAEGAMEHGPEFINAVLNCEERADTMFMLLYHEHAIQDWDTDVPDGDFMPPITEGPAKDPETKQRPLYTMLLEHMASLVPCPLGEVVSRIAEGTEDPTHSLAGLDMAGKARLLQGLDLVYIEEGQEE